MTVNARDSSESHAGRSFVVTWTVEAVFQFDDEAHSTERQPIWQGDRETCEKIAGRIEQKSQLGIRGIRYDGGRTPGPVGVYVVTGPVE